MRVVRDMMRLRGAKAKKKISVFKQKGYVWTRAQSNSLKYVWGVAYIPGGAPNNGLYEKALPERGIFLRLQVYERVEILLVEVHEREGKSVIWVCERVQRANR